MNELERVEAQAMREAVTLAGGRAELVGGALCTAHPVTRMLNRAMPVGAHVDVDAVLRWFDGTPHLFATRDDLQLEAQGYTRGYAWMKFERGTDPAPEAPTDLRVEETLDQDAFALACAEGFGLAAPPIVGAPGWACFVAWDGGEPAACAAVYADGETGWLGVAATRPAFRRRGAQRALLAARIDAARAAGVRRLTTETGERVPGRPDQSYRNILRAGFREAYLRPNWASPR